MRNVIDSFLKYLATNAPSLNINYLRHEADNPSAEELKLNALNVHVLTVAPAVTGSHIRVSLDLISDNEATFWTQLGLLFDLFKASYFTPILDYTVPSAPVATGKNVYWEGDKVRFSKIASGNYCHYTCVLTLKYA